MSSKIFQVVQAFEIALKNASAVKKNYQIGGFVWRLA